MPNIAYSPEITLEVKRSFAATRERIFSAWTDPTQLAHWFAPSADYTILVPELDLRVGGRYIIEMHHKNGAVQRILGEYREVTPPARLTFTWQWDREGSFETLVTLELFAMPQGTDLVLRHSNFTDCPDRDRHAQGWEGCLSQLATLFP